MKLTLKLLLLLPFITLSGTATSEDLHKVEDFVFLGVSLGNSADEVIKGLSEYYSISPAELKFTKNLGDKAIVYIDYIADGVKVSAFLDNDENVLDMLLVNLEKENPNTFTKDAIDQYGSHSIAAEIFETHIWCEQLNTSKDNCELDTDMLRISEHPVNTGVYAVLMKDYAP